MAANTTPSADDKPYQGPRTLFVAGPAYVCLGEALNEDYNGYDLRISDLKNAVRSFYGTKKRYATKKGEKVARPHVLDLGWQHPDETGRAGRIGENRELFIDSERRLIPVMRVNGFTPKGREIINILTDPNRSAEEKQIGISLETKYLKAGSGADSRLVAKYITGNSLVVQPAHHSTGTYVTHWAASEKDLLTQLFGSTPEEPTSAMDDEEAGLSTTPRQPETSQQLRPIFVSKALRKRVSKTLGCTIPPNAGASSLQEDDKDDVDDDGGNEEDIEMTPPVADPVEKASETPEDPMDVEPAYPVLQKENKTEDASVFDAAKESTQAQGKTPAVSDNILPPGSTEINSTIMASPNNNKKDQDAMDIDEPAGKTVATPTPKTAALKRTREESVATPDDKSSKSGRSGARGSPQAGSGEEARYDYDDDDVKQQLDDSHEALAQLTSLLGISNDPAAMGAYLEELKRVKTAEVLEKQKAAVSALELLLEKGQANDDEIRGEVSSFIQDAIGGKELSQERSRDFVKVISAAAMSLGKNPILLEADHQREMRNASVQRTKGATPHPKQQQQQYQDTGKPTGALTLVHGKAAAGTGVFDLGQALSLRGGKANGLFEQSFNSMGVIKRGGNEYGGYADVDRYNHVPSNRQQQQQQPTLKNAELFKVPRKVNYNAHSRVSASQYDDAMDIDGRGGNNEENLLIQQQRIDSLKNEQLSYQNVGRIPAKNFAFPKNSKGNAYQVDGFGFEKILDNLENDSFMHTVVENIIYPSLKTATNPNFREKLNRESHLYSDPSNYTGYVPRIIGSDEPLMSSNPELTDTD